VDADVPTGVGLAGNGATHFVFLVVMVRGVPGAEIVPVPPQLTMERVDVVAEVLLSVVTPTSEIPGGAKFTVPLI
jgi:hypothetical protein